MYYILKIRLQYGETSSDHCKMWLEEVFNSITITLTILQAYYPTTLKHNTNAAAIKDKDTAPNAILT